MLFARSIWIILFAASLACSNDGAAPDASSASSANLGARTSRASGPKLAIDPATVGVVRGRVRYAGKPPERKALAIGSIAGCAHDGALFSESAIVDANGEVQNAIVFVKSGLEGWQISSAPSSASSALVLDQSGCTYSPHVLAIEVGRRLEVHNSDPTTHNVHFFAARDANPNGNFTQAPGSPKVEVKFAVPELGARVGCDIHPWMSSWIGAFDHPFFAVSGADGSFEIRGVPPGEYELEAWHELFGRVSAKAKLAANGIAELELVFSAH